MRLRANAAASGMKRSLRLGIGLGTRNGLGRCTIFSPGVVYFLWLSLGEAWRSLCLLFADWEGISGGDGSNQTRDLPRSFHISIISIGNTKTMNWIVELET